MKMLLLSNDRNPIQTSILKLKNKVITRLESDLKQSI